MERQVLRSGVRHASFVPFDGAVDAATLRILWRVPLSTLESPPRSRAIPFRFRRRKPETSHTRKVYLCFTYSQMREPQHALQIVLSCKRC